MPATAETSLPVYRNVSLLAVAQGLFMSVQGMGIATSPLAGHALLGPDKSLATLPIFLNHAGIMLTTIPASLLMARIGRRAGFSIGALLGIAFGLLAAFAVWRQDFWLLCAATLLQGASAAFAWYYRFAAADAAPPRFKPKAISLVMAGGVIAGFLGPQVAKYTVHWFDPVTFMGVYVAVALVGLASLVLVQGLRIPKLSAEQRAHGGRPLAQIARQPAYRVAVISSMFGYAVMTLVMSATPLAMLACGYGFTDSATVIQVHIVAMFLPSFFTGSLIARVGVLPVIATGAVIELGCALVNLAGIDFMNFFIANALVGLGWNFTYVGGSTLLTRTYTASERARVQASHDFIVYATTAAAAASAGFLQQRAGWTVLNLAALPVLSIVLCSALWLLLRERRDGALKPAE
jgi:MFS family permease